MYVRVILLDEEALEFWQQYGRRLGAGLTSHIYILNTDTRSDRYWWRLGGYNRELSLIYRDLRTQ